MSSTAERPSTYRYSPPSDRRARMVSQLGLLVALGLILQIIEGMIPPILPLPGAKLGLANLATLVALILLGPWEAITATLVMAALYMLQFPPLSITGISIAGAVTHNAVQLGVAIWLVGFPGLRHLLPYLLLIAIPTGFFIGIIAQRLALALSRTSLGGVG